jgi:hypothetical protein
MILMVLVAVVVLPEAGLAYVGPGSGLTMLGALAAVIGAVLFTIFGIVLWPLRYLRRKLKANKAESDSNDPQTVATDND